MVLASKWSPLFYITSVVCRSSFVYVSYLYDLSVLGFFQFFRNSMLLASSKLLDSSGEKGSFVLRAFVWW